MARSSVANVSIRSDELVFLPRRRIQPYATSQVFKSDKNINIFSCFLQDNSGSKGLQWWLILSKTKRGKHFREHGDWTILGIVYHRFMNVRQQLPYFKSIAAYYRQTLKQLALCSRNFRFDTLASKSCIP